MPSAQGKRARSSHSPATVSKTKAEGNEADFSQNVKKKLSSSTRTGQACDRCKNRKIRCDGLLGGCSPCTQNHTECKTTDRITGRATTRGHVEDLEHRTQRQENRIRELEERLLSMGVDVKPSNTYTAPLSQHWSLSQSSSNGHGVDDGQKNAANGDQLQYSSASDARAPEGHLFRLPEFRHGLTGDNYLGVSSGNSFISSIRGTALNVLGMEINITDFTSADLDEPKYPVSQKHSLYNKSYQSFVQSAFGVNQRLAKVDLPPKNEGLTYAQWYFRALSPFIPILHRPTFMGLLTRFYEVPNFEPSPAEIVMVHMMFAILFFQYAARNWENASQQSDLNTRSNMHYHYSLSYLSQLVTSHTLQDVQAMALISAHVRNFAKPGPCSMIVNMTFNLAIELGLHRSAKRWAPTTPKKNILEIEMRKRVFWCILMIHMMISGKLGRPMALRMDDIDVEMPEPIDDELLHEHGIDTSRPGHCGFRVSLEAFKMVPTYMELFDKIYSVKRSPHIYIETVRRLETQVRQWTEQCPNELTLEATVDDQESRMFALYLSLWALEFRLLLRHPSLSLTTSVDFNNENLIVCMEASRGLLQHVKQIQKFKSLDTTWYNAALYVLAVSTTLFGHWQRKDDVTQADLATLKEDMEAWLSIIGDVGGLLGSGKRLQSAVRVSVDNTLGLLTRHLASKTASSALTTVSQNETPESSPNQNHQPQPIHQEYSSSNYTSYPQTSNVASGPLTHNIRNNTYLPPDDTPNMANHTPHPYPTHYPYPEPSPIPMSYHRGNPTSFDHPPYPTAVAAEALSTTPHHQAHPHPHPHPHHHSTPQQAAAVAPNAFMYSPAHTTPNYAYGGSQQWRQWTDTMASNLEPQEYLNSASALMQLGGRNDQGPNGGGGAPVADMTGPQLAQAAADASAMSAGAEHRWPLLFLGMGPGES